MFSWKRLHGLLATRREQRADKDHGIAQTVAEAKTPPVLHNLANGEDIAAQLVAWPIKLVVAQCLEKNDTHHTTHTHTHTQQTAHHITHNTNTTHTHTHNTTKLKLFT